MAGLLGKYQKSPTFTYWKGLTKENHLGGIFQRAPQKASDLMVKLLAFNRAKTLDSFLSQFPTKTFESDDEYTWDVVGSSRRNIRLVEARTSAGVVVTANTTVGANVEPFELVFAEDWFADGEVIVGNLNEKYLMRILGDARMEGLYYVYKVELMGGNTTGMPGERLLAGEQFSVEYAPVEKELSRGVGDIRFASSIKMRNEFSTIRIKHKVSGKMLNKKLAFGIPLVDKNGQKRVENMWMHYEDYELECQFGDAKNNLLAFGRSNRNENGEYLNIGKSGEVIRMGAGLYEQMEVANTYYYDEFTIELLQTVLYELLAAKEDFGNRHLYIKTGERGALKFHKAVANAVNGFGGWQLNGDALGVVNKTSSKLNKVSLAAGYQFTEYRMPNGVVVTLDVDPYYDDPVRNKVKHPEGGPAFSYRFDIFDVGSMDQPNIFKCVIADQPEIRGYEWGLRNPFTGQMNNPNMTHDEDSATIHKMASLGVCVLDPTRTVSLIPNILA